MSNERRMCNCPTLNSLQALEAWIQGQGKNYSTSKSQSITYLDMDKIKKLNSVYGQHEVELFESNLNKKVKVKLSGSQIDVSLCVLVLSNASNNSSAKSNKWKVSAHGKQALALDGLEYYRLYLKSQGLGVYPVDII
ncbi:hypothetical protein AYI69_g11511 [Smittium culicis]|uniref:Uncharacterized protein n=1 Tax=Smittium culicis TaxID=133412 RepID=A0A1R1WY05_9FUNG|nr:hypothetical protein AYI69_g11511 [Smittium culicis]